MSLFPPSESGPIDTDFNLARLFVGSEGTLGLTVEAKLKLVELPRCQGHARRRVRRLARSPGGHASDLGARTGGG